MVKFCCQMIQAVVTTVDYNSQNKLVAAQGSMLSFRLVRLSTLSWPQPAFKSTNGHLFGFITHLFTVLQQPIK